MGFRTPSEIEHVNAWPPKDIEPKRCPNCGRLPKLRQLDSEYGGFSSESVYTLKVECRKWFGLRRCFGPHASNRIEKDWHDLGVRVAIMAWNFAVDGDVRRPPWFLVA
jgi:hypothetical protein